MPSTMILVISLTLLRRHRHYGIPAITRGEVVDALLDLGPEMPDQALHRPSRRVAERADGVALGLHGHFEQEIVLLLLGLATHHARQHTPHPARAFAARRALTAALLLIEVRQPGDGLDHVRGLVHDD